MVLGLEKIFVPIGPKMAKSCFLGLKWVPKVVLGLEKIFIPIDPKMAKLGPKVVF